MEMQNACTPAATVQNGSTDLALLATEDTIDLES